eukprot:jgi/Mesvir1/13109/Mv06088-RA.1
MELPQMGGTPSVEPGHRPYKRKTSISDQQKRRQVALERQKTARREIQEHARSLAGLISGPQSPDEVDRLERASSCPDIVVDKDVMDMDANRQKVPLTQVARKMYRRVESLDCIDALEATGSQQTLPEWMVDIPPDLARNWFVMARPEGVRCLVVVARGRTESRLKSGKVLHRGFSFLPNGSKATATSSSVFSILDCIYHERDDTYYVIDMMCWKGYLLYDCTAEFRLYWVNTKLHEETPKALEPVTAEEREAGFHRFVPVASYKCDLQGLAATLGAQQAYTTDGLLLYNKLGHYHLGLTPLVLLWKDAQCSPYLLETDANGGVPDQQLVVLQLLQDGTVGTSDEPPVVLGKMPESFLMQHMHHLRPGSLLRFAIMGKGLTTVNGVPANVDIQFRGDAKRRGLADTCSKILFQNAARYDPLTIHHLVAHIEAELGLEPGAGSKLFSASVASSPFAARHPSSTTLAAMNASSNFAASSGGGFPASQPAPFAPPAGQVMPPVMMGLGQMPPRPDVEMNG